LPSSLKRAVEEVAREDGTTLNQFIVSAVVEKLAALKTAEYFAKRAARAGGEAPGPDDEIPENYRKRNRRAGESHNTWLARPHCRSYWLNCPA
jgi:hypothetical protein